MRGGRFAGTLALLLLLAPVVWAVWVSFTPDEFLAPPTHTWSRRWYGQFFRDPRWRLAALNSLLTATLAAGTALLAGTPLALAAARYHFRGRRLLTAAVLTPLCLPPLVLGLGLLPLASALGLTGTRLLLVLVHAILGLGVVVLVVRQQLEQTSPDLELAARGLGAGPVRTFFRVTLPQLVPALVAGAVMAFLLSLNESVLCLFLAGPENETLPRVIWPNLRYKLSPLVAVASSLTMLLTGVGLLLLRWLANRGIPWLSPRSPRSRALRREDRARSSPG
jgi:ABC-type spermidine/putrescine transport system permease subunit II